MKNAIDICVPYFERLTEIEEPNVQILGGVASVALTHPDTEVLPEDKRLVLETKPDDERTFLPQYRDGKSLRDLDVLVLSSDQTIVDAEEAVAQETIGDELVLSFFKMRSMTELDELAAHPLKAALSSKSALADRYVTSDGYGNIDKIVKAVYPFEIPLDPQVLETWTLEFNGLAVPIPHPGVSVLNYATRSISGLRPKDAAKAHGIAANILPKAPEMKDWLIDGPGQGLYQMACLFQNLRSPAGKRDVLPIGSQTHMITLFPTQQGIEPEALTGRFLQDMSPRQQAAAIRLARLKSRGIHLYERNEKLVDFWQRRVETLKVVTAFVKND